MIVLISLLVVRVVGVPVQLDTARAATDPKVC
jgi:hypothetical protein